MEVEDNLGKDLYKSYLWSITKFLLWPKQIKRDAELLSDLSLISNEPGSDPGPPTPSSLDCLYQFLADDQIKSASLRTAGAQKAYWFWITCTAVQKTSYQWEPSLGPSLNKTVTDVLCELWKTAIKKPLLLQSKSKGHTEHSVRTTHAGILNFYEDLIRGHQVNALVVVVQ